MLVDPNFSGHEQSCTISQGYEVEHLRNSFKKFYGRYPDLIGKHQRSVKDMVADSFPD